MLLPGDPGRVPVVASLWDEAREVAGNREYVTFTGTYRGVPISCTSTGIGAPSTAIALEELARVGATTFLRIGTCGALQPHARVGHIAIFDSAIRADGASALYAPLGVPGGRPSRRGRRGDRGGSPARHAVARGDDVLDRPVLRARARFRVRRVRAVRVARAVRRHRQDGRARGRDGGERAHGPDEDLGAPRRRDRADLRRRGGQERGGRVRPAGDVRRRTRSRCSGSHGWGARRPSCSTSARTCPKVRSGSGRLRRASCRCRRRGTRPSPGRTGPRPTRRTP